MESFRKGTKGWEVNVKGSPSPTPPPTSPTPPPTSPTPPPTSPTPSPTPGPPITACLFPRIAKKEVMIRSSDNLTPRLNCFGKM